MSDRPDGQMQRNRDIDNYGFYSLCSQPGAVAALSYALFGSEVRGQRCPGAVGGDSIVGHGNANPDVRGLREALCALFERNDEHITENHRRPLSRCETRKLQMRRKVCKVCARLVRTFLLFAVRCYGCYCFGSPCPQVSLQNVWLSNH